MARESWEEVSFQVFTDAEGVLRSGWYPTGNGTVEGNMLVDFVWGNFPLQPNEDRVFNAGEDEVVAPDASGNYDWSGYSVYPSELLDPDLDNHAIALANYAGYPGFVASQANYIVTAAEGDGTTVTYTAQNNLKAGDVVTITRLSTSAFNLSSVTVAYADAVKFKVTNAATGEDVYGGRGRVEVISTTDDGAYVGGVAYVTVPDVRGFTTALAQDDLRDAGLVVTTATAATNTKTSITRFNATSASVAVVYATNAHTNYPVGTKVEIFAGTPAGVSPVNPPAYAVGTWTVTGSAGAGQITVSGSGFTVADTTGINATGTLAGKGGTIKTQSVAGGAASIAAGAAVTITPWATAS